MRNVRFNLSSTITPRNLTAFYNMTYKAADPRALGRRVLERARERERARESEREREREREGGGEEGERYELNN